MTNDETSPKGIGGWLILLALGVVAAPFVQLFNARDFLEIGAILSRQSGFHTAFRALVFGELALIALLLVWSSFNYYLFFARKLAFRGSWIGYLWTALVYFIADLAAASAVADLPVEPAERMQALTQGFWAIVWTLYLLRSKRVAATFVHDVGRSAGRIANRAGALAAFAFPLVASLLFALADSLRPMAPRDVASQAMAAFVSIEGFLDGASITTGSGFVITPDGQIMTNLHVIQGSQQLALTLWDGTVVEDVSVLAVSESDDLALLQIEGDWLPHLELGNDEDLAVGDTVYVLGNPMGMEQTFTDGLVSALRVDENTERLQISAPISEGSSGGPVLDRSGDVIGVTVAYVPGGQNLNLAVPARFVQALLDRAGPPQRFADVAAQPLFAASDTVYGRQIDFAAIFAELPRETRERWGDLEPWQQQTYTRAHGFETALAAEGWHLSAEEFELDLLAQDEYASYELELPAGEYLLLAVCDNDCLDLDLGVEWAGQALLQDTELDANPMVRFDLEQAATVSVYASLVSCAMDTCGYLLELYETPPR